MKVPKELTTVTKLSKYLAMVVFIALPFVGFFLGMQYQETLDLANRQQMEANLAIPRIPTPTHLSIPTVDSSVTANWKTYTLGSTGLQVQLPPQIAFKDKIEHNVDGNGTKYEVYSALVSGGQVTPSNDPLMISANSIDFSAPRSAIFNDIQGYFKQNGNYYVNWALSYKDKKPELVPSELSPKEIINSNGVHVLKLKNPDPNNPYPKFNFLMMPTDLGSIMNTNNKTYPGVTFQVDSDSLDEKTFDQILSTFKFTP